MLEFIRGFSRSIVAKTLFSLIALVFVLWGMGGVIAHLGTPDYLLKVGNKKVTAHEFNLAYQRYKAHLQERLGFISDEKARELKLPEHVLASLTHQNLIALELVASNLCVGDEVVKAVMRTDPRFQDNTGAFNKNQLRAALASFHMPEEAFLTHLHKETEARLFSLPFFISIMPPAYVMALNAAVTEKREIACVTIGPKNVETLTRPSDEVLKQFYTDNQELFIVPEERSFTLAEIDKSAIEKTIKVDESEIAQAYDRYIERSTDEPTIKSLEEMRSELEKDLRLEVLSERMAEIARTIEDALAEGKKFEEIASQYPIKHLISSKFSVKLDPKEKFLQNPYAEETVELFKELSDAEEGGNGTFLETRNGRWIFARVDKIDPEHVADFSIVKNKAFACWGACKKKESMEAQAQTIIEELKKGKALKDLAVKYHLAYHILSPFSRMDMARGNVPKGEGITSDFLGHLQQASIGEGVIAVSHGRTENPGIVLVGVVIRTFSNAGNEKSSEEKISWHKQIEDDLLNQALRYSEKQHSIKINEQAFKALGAVEPISYDE
ncbi:MAG: SurA N-terminal domain-containing protein [Holosporales bacterium]|jgi:peptidyl-prolyl cis-trans isomerase D|nr:SurA N-terminal domain-containing protein [Holosporales bacterium]